MSAVGTPAATILTLLLEDLLDSPYQPPGRSERNIDELAASMAALGADGKPRGQTTPILVRHLDDGTMRIVGGHRRKRALERVQIVPHALCMVREMTDEEERELALVDNIQREDLTPLEEAAELGRMRDELQRTPEQIAGRTGKPLSRIYRRLLLLQLTTPSRKALEEGRIVLGVAERLAGLTDPTAQAEALDLVLPRDGDEPVTVKHAMWRIEGFQYRLDDVPWELADGSLPGGACAVCPKRTAAQLVLIGEAVPTTDRCTDRICFGQKRDESTARRKASAGTAGLRVIEGAEAKKLYPHGGSYLADRELVDLGARYPHDPAPEFEATTGKDDEDHEDHEPGPPERTWREALGERLKPDAIVITPDGKIREVTTQKAAAAAMRAAGFSEAAESAERVAKAEKTAAKPAKVPWDIERKAEEIALDEAFELIVAKAEGTKKPDEKAWRHVVALLVHGMGEDTAEEICDRRELLPKKTTDDRIPERDEEARAALLGFAKTASSGELFGLVVELCIRVDLNFPPSTHLTADVTTAFQLACRPADVDLAELRALALSKVKADAKKPAKGKAAKASPTPARSDNEEESPVENAKKKPVADPSPEVIEEVHAACANGKTILQVSTATRRGLLEVEAALQALFLAGRVSFRNGKYTRVGKPSPSVHPLAVPCPTCLVPLNLDCKKAGGGFHAQRTKAARDVAAGPAPVDPPATSGEDLDEPEAPNAKSVGPLDVACGHCGAAVGEACVAGNGLPTKPHAARCGATARLAVELAGKSLATEPETATIPEERERIATFLTALAKSERDHAKRNEVIIGLQNAAAAIRNGAHGGAGPDGGAWEAGGYLRERARGAAEPLKTRLNTAAKGIEHGKHLDAAKGAPEVKEDDVETVESECRVCACRDTEACVDAGGITCVWADVGETLCSSCAATMQDVEERLEHRTRFEKDLITEIVEASDDNERRIVAAIEDLIRQRRVQRFADGTIARQLKLPVATEAIDAAIEKTVAKKGRKGKAK